MNIFNRFEAEFATITAQMKADGELDGIHGTFAIVRAVQVAAVENWPLEPEDVEAEYEALEKSLKDDGVEDSKGDDATTTLPALPNVPTMPPVALPPPPGTKAAKSCAA